MKLKNILGCSSWVLGLLIDEKTRGKKSRDTVSLSGAQLSLWS
jgi:hypothetical protein